MMVFTNDGSQVKINRNGIYLGYGNVLGEAGECDGVATEYRVFQVSNIFLGTAI